MGARVNKLPSRTQKWRRHTVTCYGILPFDPENTTRLAEVNEIPISERIDARGTAHVKKMTTRHRQLTSDIVAVPGLTAVVLKPSDNDPHLFQQRQPTSLEAKLCFEINLRQAPELVETTRTLLRVRVHDTLDNLRPLNHPQREGRGLKMA